MGKNKTKTGSILFIVILIFLSLLNIVPLTTTADPLTTVTVDVIPSFTMVKVSPGSSGITSVVGNVTCENVNTAIPLLVNLSAESTIGNATITPPTMAFQDDHQSSTFQVGVKVPIGTSASEDHLCTVSGTWSQGVRSGEVEPDTFQIIILPYYRLRITCNSRLKEVTQGESTSFYLLINNSGNTDDVYHVDITNRAGLKEKAITIDEIDDIPIQEDGFKEIELKVGTSEETKVKVSAIDVVVTSTFDEESSKVFFVLTIQINERTLGETIVSSPIIPIIIVVVIIAGIVVYIKKRESPFTPPNP